MSKPRSKNSSVQSRKLTRLLAQFTPGEMLKLQRYLYSPFFEVSEDVIQLFGAIELAHPAFSKKMPRDEFLFKAAYPGEPFSQQKLNKLFHKLYRHTRYFLAHQALKEDAFITHLSALKKVRSLKDDSHFETLTTELLDALDHLKAHNKGKGYIGELVRSLKGNLAHEVAYYEYFLLAEQYLHISTPKFRSDLELLPRAIEALDRHFIYNRLFLACEAENRRQFINQSFDLMFEDVVESYARKRFADKDFVIEFYLNLLRLFRNRHDDGLFKNMMGSFIDRLPNIDRKLARALLVFLVNYANQVFKNGESGYIKHIHQLYQAAHREGLLFEDNQITELKFTNVVIASALTGNFEAGYQFINDADTKLPRSSRQRTISICKAFLLFHQKEFLQAQDLLIVLPVGPLYQELISRPLMLRCFYELWEPTPKESHEHILSGIAAFRRYLERSQDLSESHRQLYYKFIFLLRKMIKYLARGQSKPSAKQRLLEQLQTAPHPIAKDWLLQKLLALP